MKQHLFNLQSRHVGEFIITAIATKVGIQHKLKPSLCCHPRACPEDPKTVAVDPRDKPEGDNVDMRQGSSVDKNWAWWKLITTVDSRE